MFLAKRWYQPNVIDRLLFLTTYIVLILHLWNFVCSNCGHIQRLRGGNGCSEWDKRSRLYDSLCELSKQLAAPACHLPRRTVYNEKKKDDIRGRTRIEHSFSLFFGGELKPLLTDNVGSSSEVSPIC